MATPAKPLPYTTTDFSKLLAKKKADYAAKAQTFANQALRYGVTNPPAEQNAASFKAFPGGVTKAFPGGVTKAFPGDVTKAFPGGVTNSVVQEDKGGGGGLWPSWGEIGNAIKSVGNTAKSGIGAVGGAVNTVVATPLDIADEAVQGLERVMGIKPTDKFDPASIGSYNLLGETYRGLNRAANYTAGTIAATPGFGKPSSSPFMDTVRSQGWLNAIAEPFVHGANVASVAFPISKVAGAAKLPGIQGIRGAQVAGEIPYTYGVHVSPVADLAEIRARLAMQQQVTALDAMPGSSYMWDARSPRTIGSIFDNAQMNPATRDYMMSPEELAAQSTPNIYITRAPAGQVFQDANIPGSSALRVAGNQEVLGQVPFDRAALQAALEKYGITPRSEAADALESQYRAMNPQVQLDIANRTQQLAEQGLRNTIIRAAEPYYAKQYPSLNTLDPNATLSDLLKNPEAKKIYDLWMNR